MYVLTSGVYFKVGLFSAALFAAPLAAYYLSREHLFDGAYAADQETPPCLVVLQPLLRISCLLDISLRPASRTTSRRATQRRANSVYYTILPSQVRGGGGIGFGFGFSSGRTSRNASFPFR